MSTRTTALDLAPAVAWPVCPYCGGYGHFCPADWAPPRPRRRRRSGLRLMRRLLGIVIALSALAAIMGAGLLLMTPSVGNATALARTLTNAHHEQYPGPAVPRRFAASLVATEDHRFYSEPGIDVFAVARVIVGRLTGQPDQGGALCTSS